MSLPRLLLARQVLPATHEDQRFVGHLPHQHSKVQAANIILVNRDTDASRLFSHVRGERSHCCAPIDFPRRHILARFTLVAQPKHFVSEGTAG
jgi:hypothetical protein